LGKKRSRKKKLLVLGILLVVILLAAIVGFKIYTSNYYAADEPSLELVQESVGKNVSCYTDDTGTVFLPKGQQVKAVIFFYPGGKVEYTAYSALMYELADKGYICVLPRMPENLAFLRVDAMDAIQVNYAQEMTAVKNLDWYLAGHSLGGVAAAKYLTEEVTPDAGEQSGGTGTKSDAFKGLILCASYPADDLSGLPLRFLSIRGSNDGVLNLKRYEESRKFWPADSTEKVIDGGIHSFFGCYGIQKGDGEPGITNMEQLETTATMIDEWISD
jgi:hypothetical protein